MGRALTHLCLCSASSPGPDTPKVLIKVCEVDTGPSGFRKPLPGPGPACSPVRSDGGSARGCQCGSSSGAVRGTRSGDVGCDPDSGPPADHGRCGESGGRSHPQECSRLDGTSCSFRRGAAPLTPEGSGLQAETGGCSVLALTAVVSAPTARPTRPFVQRTTWWRAGRGQLSPRPPRWPPDRTLVLQHLPLLTFQRPPPLPCTALWRYGLILGPTRGAASPDRVETRRNVDLCLAGQQSRAGYY